MMLGRVAKSYHFLHHTERRQCVEVLRFISECVAVVYTG
jgi:hypothetical protein